MTLNELKAHLKTLDPALPLVFETEGGEIGSGYHVTEFKLARVSGIDCGGNVSNWTESVLQLLDGEGGDHMNVGKFGAILETSLRHVAGLGDAPLHVEFALGNDGLATYTMNAPESRDARAVVSLRSGRAVCKPAVASAMAGISAACCGESARPSTGCCA